MFHRILVGMDGSTESHRACRAAADLAGRYHSILTLATVVSPKAGATGALLNELLPKGEEQKSLRVQLDEARKDALARGARAVQVVALHGKVLESLLDYLAKNRQDLVVVGSRGLSRSSRLLFGSVSIGLVGEAPCPILVVRSGGKRHLAPADPEILQPSRSRDSELARHR